MSEVMNDIKQMVIDHGDAVEIHDATCIAWKARHENCKDCPSSLGCARMLQLGIVMMLPTIYSPSSFEDFQKMTARVQELMDLTMEAKSVEEIKSIPKI